MHPDFKPVSLFAGLFSEKWVQFEIDEFANWLRSTLPDFDQPHTKPKIPQNAPGEMPRFVLMGGNKTKILEVAPKKINLRWVRKVGNLPLIQLKDEFNSLVSNIIYKTSEYDYSFNRLGIILTLFREFREDGTPVSSNQKLVDYFFQKRDIFEPTPSEAHLNVHTKMKFDEKFSGNRWIRIRPLRRNSQIMKIAGFRLRLI